jgi:hypothetical protein
MSQSKARTEVENRRLAAENAELFRLVVRLVELYWGESAGSPPEWPVEAGPQPSWWWTAVAL